MWPSSQPPRRHWPYRAFRQYAHRPHPEMQETRTRSPGTRSSMSEPVSTTMPTASWPRTRPGSTSGTSPARMCRSVPQMAAVVTWMITSPQIGDPGIGHGRPGLFSGPLIPQRLHGSSARRPARLPIPRIPRTFPVRPRSTTVTRPSGDRASGGRSLPAAARMTHSGGAAGPKSTITAVKTRRAPRTGTIDPEAHRVLGGVSRVAVLETLRRAGRPLAISEIADAVGLHPNTVRAHLALLIEHGHVAGTREDRDRPGRPRTLYTAVRAQE